MTASVSPRFDVDALRQRAGDTQFARGEDYYRGGQVELFAVEQGCVLAEVAGRDDYRVEVSGSGAVETLRARLSKEEPTRWSYPADLLIHVLIREHMFESAWATVRAQGASMGVKQSLARASEATHPRVAIEVYAERVDQLATLGGNPAYEEAAEMVARMASLRSSAEQAAYVAALKANFGRKRNFMKLLE